jgi:5'-3' exonuclease
LDVYLVDGTYELFRHYYALPSARDQNGCEVAAVRGVLASVLRMIKGGATHLAVATDHVIESFRNGLWPSYKTGEGIDPDLLAQFQLLEDVLSTAGVVVWPMVEFEADDALAAAAMAAARDPRVERVIICTPDKDLAQCVRGTRIVQLNRRTRVTRDEAGVVQPTGLDPRLPRTRRRRGRRLPGSARLGSQVDRCCTLQVSPSRIHPRGLARGGT